MKTTVLPLALLAAACAGSADASLDARSGLPATARAMISPAVVDGCGDVFVYAASADESKALFVVFRGELAAEATQTQQTVERSYTLPHPDIDVYAQWGSELTVDTCTDVFTGAPVVNGEATAIDGTVHLTLEPTGPYQPWDMPSHATVELDGVSLQAPGGRIRSLSTTLEAAVGWLPG
jgi:hypothetical protein